MFPNSLYMLASTFFFIIFFFGIQHVIPKSKFYTVDVESSELSRSPVAVL